MSEILKSIGVARLFAMAGLTAVAVGVLLYVSGGISDTPKALLFSNLDPRDSAEIANRLDSMKVPYELQGEGSTVLVPSDQVLKLRMQFAGDGLPVGLHIVGRMYDDVSVLRAAYAYEQAQPWRKMHPPLAMKAAKAEKPAAEKSQDGGIPLPNTRNDPNDYAPVGFDKDGKLGTGMKF